ncbi:nuclear transport factor 2 family protein [Streptomyces sp. NPDC057690]|uniref:nuclear transport factor 2 family protein n=1 Tax=Streptomyces sp. NPDC057690 TaxID=3346214 RepID=UPI00369DCCA8
MASRNMETLRRMIGSGTADFNKERTSETYEQRMAGFYQPDVEVHEPACLPHGGIHRGRDTWFKVRRTMMSHWEQNLDILHIWEDPEADVVILNYMMDWTARSTGRNFRMPAIEVLTFEDGKIAKVEFYPRDAKVMAESLEPAV